MSVLSKDEAKAIRERHKDYWYGCSQYPQCMGRISTDLFDCLDTIADRDKQIEEMKENRMKVKGNVDINNRFWLNSHIDFNPEVCIIVGSVQGHETHDLAKQAAEKFATEHGFEISWEEAK